MAKEIKNSKNIADFIIDECLNEPFLIFNENNIETMKKMPDNLIDLTVTSPPYDKLRTYNGYSF